MRTLLLDIPVHSNQRRPTFDRASTGAAGVETNLFAIYEDKSSNIIFFIV